MAVPLPAPGTEKRTRPDAAEAELIGRAIASAAMPPEGPTELQRVMVEALVPALTDHPISLADFEPLVPEEFAAAMADRELGFRSRTIQMAVLNALILRPLPPTVADRIDGYARALGVEEGMLSVVHRFATGSLGLAALDFDRNGYTSDWHPEAASWLHTSHELASAWEQTVHDEALAARWCDLEHLPAGTLGRGVWELYRARGFVYPGRPGSAPPLLAQHDWVHVLADYGTTVESEVEVFALISRANDDPRAFSLLAMVVSLFETGYLRTGAGLFEYDTGHLSSLGRSMAVRLGDALRRGALMHDHRTGSDSIDLLGVDWFELAPLPLPEARAVLGLVPKRPEAVEHGSVGPWEPGGISEFQCAAGRAQAEQEGRAYDAYGACPA